MSHNFNFLMLDFQIIPDIPSNIDNDFENFLTKCLEISEHDRWTTDKLLNHSFLLKSSDKPLSKLDDKDDEMVTVLSNNIFIYLYEICS